MTDAILYHGPITAKGVLHAERLLAGYAGRLDETIHFHVVSGGGDSASSAALYAMIKAMPIPVRTFTSGICASGGVSIFLAGHERIVSPATMFMLHASTAPNGTISPQVGILRETYRHALAWDDAQLDEFFATVDEKWFPPARAIELGLATEMGDFALQPGAAVHIVEP